MQIGHWQPCLGTSSHPNAAGSDADSHHVHSHKTLGPHSEAHHSRPVAPNASPRSRLQPLFMTERTSYKYHGLPAFFSSHSSLPQPSSLSHFFKKPALFKRESYKSDPTNTTARPRQPPVPRYVFSLAAR